MSGEHILETRGLTKEFKGFIAFNLVIGYVGLFDGDDCREGFNPASGVSLRTRIWQVGSPGQIIRYFCFTSWLPANSCMVPWKRMRPFSIT
jgi:hypothetical protein